MDRKKLFCYLVLLSGVSFATVNAQSGCTQDLHTCSEELENHQTETVLALKQIFNDQQMCTCKYDASVIKKLKESDTRLDTRSKALVTALTVSGTSSARVPHPALFPKLSTPVNFSCESHGHNLTFCMWQRSRRGQREFILVDQQAIHQGGETSMEGITSVGGDAAKCALNIQSVTESHLGLWKCTLVSEDGYVFTGELSITEHVPVPEFEPSIYFVTWAGRMSSYSMRNSGVETILSWGSSFRAIAYDSWADKIYWSSEFTIYRAQRDGTGYEAVLSTEYYNKFYGLAFDWIAGNIFVATWGGYILACTAGNAPGFVCAEVLSGEGTIQGIAVNPLEGKIYWTSYSHGAIYKADMDGRNKYKVVSGLRDPYGVAIDFQNQRLYWTDENNFRIQSSDLNGHGVYTSKQLGEGTNPFGVTVAEDRIYWSTWGSKKLQSMSKSSSYVHTHYTGSSEHHIAHITVVGNMSYLLRDKRANHCAGQICSKVCVLTSDSFRCVY